MKTKALYYFLVTLWFAGLATDDIVVAYIAAFALLLLLGSVIFNTKTHIEVLSIAYHFKEGKAMKVVIYKDKKGEWRWQLKSRNGNILADSGEGYKTRYGATLAVKKFLVADLKVVYK